MLTLVVGGSASGKSAFAERLAVQSGLAALLRGDHACLGRGEREARGAPIGPCGGKSGLKRWNAAHLEKWTCRRAGTALLEDMGNLAANELYDADGAKADAVSAILRGADRLRAQCAHLIIVSNEVFRGGADYAGDTDAYLLALAQINNALAARAENVCRVVCGIPKWVKGGNGLDRA